MLARVACAVVLAAVLGCGGAKNPPKESSMSDRSSAAEGDRRPQGAGPVTAPAAASRPTDRAAGPGLPEGWEMVPTATFTAAQRGGEVVIRAKGENPTAGYETKFMQSMLRIWPPQYSLIRRRPAGVAAQVITPFNVTTAFKAAEPVPQVVVRDGMGRHEVNVAAGR